MAGKVALITGAAQGLGKAFAEALLQRGAKVCLCDINHHVGQSTLNELTSKYGQSSSIFVDCDVTKKEDLERVFGEAKRAFGAIDIVCNNAGIGNESKWEMMVDINLKAVVHGTLLGLQYMGKDKGGKGGVIINVSSLAGLRPMPFGPVYCATKYGVVGLTRSYGSPLNLKHYGVRVNCLCPAFADTNILKVTPDHVLHFDMAKALMKSKGIIPLKDVTDAFLQVVDDESKNGEALKITVSSGIEYVEFPASKV